MKKSKGQDNVLWKGLPATSGHGIDENLALHIPGQPAIPLQEFDTQWIESGSLTIFADTRAYGERTMPTAPDGPWLWVSYCGFRGTIWCDGPLARLVGDRIADYAPAIGPCELAFAALAPEAPLADWNDRPRVHRQDFLAAANAARFAWPEPIVVTGISEGAEQELALVCLAKAWGELRVEMPPNRSPRLRKLLLHLNAHYVEDRNAKALTSFLPYLRGFENLAADIGELSPIIP